MNAWIHVDCTCGARTRAAAALAGGMIPCSGCGRGVTATSEGPRGRAIPALPTRPLRPLRALREAETQNSTPALVAALVGLTLISFVIRGQGPAAETPLQYLLSTLFCASVGGLVLLFASHVFGESLGTLGEASLKVLIQVQVVALIGSFGMSYLQGPSGLLAIVVILISAPGVIVGLFKWSWPTAALTAIAQLVALLGASYAMAQALQGAFA